MPKRKRDVEVRPPKRLTQRKWVDEELQNVVQVQNGLDEEHDSENGDDEPEDNDQAEHRDNGDVEESDQKSSNKLPSASELRAINEAANLFRNNTFKYQLDTLLANVRPKESYVAPLERTLQKLYTYLTSLPSLPPAHPLDAPSILETIVPKKGRRPSGKQPMSVSIPYPMPIPPQSTVWKVAFEPPEAMNLVGSWSDELAVRKPDGAPLGVDLVVEMPASLFQEKDYRNSRFFHKRAFYVACLAMSLSHSSFNLDLRYEAVEGDVRLTNLLLLPRKDGSEHDFSKLHAMIRIIPVLPDDAPIPVHRLSPVQANIRTASESTLAEEPQTPTPQYNNTLALSFAHVSRIHLLGAHSLVGAVPSFKHGLALLRVWANQRGFGAGPAEGSGTGPRNYCVRGFEGLGAWWACLLEVLIYGEEPMDEGGNKHRLKRPLVGRGLSSYQLFRAVLDFLSHHDFEADPVFMKLAEHGHRFDRAEWTTYHRAIFVDASGTVNMLAGVQMDSLRLLRHDAKNTLQVLNNGEDPFSPVFLRDMREPHTRFDTVIRINLAQIQHHISLDFHSPQAATLHAVALTVRKALGVRAHVVVSLHPRSAPWPLSAAQPAPLSILILGIIFDPAHATRLVDHGPAVATPEVEEFRAFWGAKAELRRFKDGGILESCVWDKGITRAEDREMIPARIVRYILNLHFGLEEQDVSVLAGDYGNVLIAPLVRGRKEGTWRDALAAFDQIAKELKALEDDGDLPLMLVSVKPCSPLLRYTSTFPPSAIPSSSTSLHPSTSYLPAFDIVLQLERSTQWPDDLRAIQKVKLAFLESMARGLKRRNSASCHACVVLEHKASEIEDAYALEVMLNGWAFHAHIGHDREAILLEDILKDSRQRPGRPLPSVQERHAATCALQAYRTKFIHAPVHHSTILALHHKLPAFAYAVRLVKRWLGAHWLSSRVTDEAAELICACVFLANVDTPSSGKKGFVRVVEFLKRWDGATYVPLYEAVREGTAVTSEHKVEAGKGSWRLITAEDPSGTIWCEGVTTAVAARVRAVAKATMECFEAGISTFSPLFVHPTVDYDFLIELDPLAVNRYWHSVHANMSVWNKAGYANLANTLSRAEEPVRVAFNPAEMFFLDLQKIYSDTAELFYDVHGGTTIGGVWTPSVAGPSQHQWRVFLGFSSLPLASSSQQQKGKPSVTFNKEGMLAEMERIGEGIITKITVRESG